MENKPQRRTIGQNTRYLRLLRCFTQEKLAELADINEKLISFYETDSRIPSLFNALGIAHALGVTVEERCGTDYTKRVEDELIDRIWFEVRRVIAEYKIERRGKDKARTNNKMK